ncbi:M20 aminoacylase family protein [Paracidovorax citrulli]|uniref:Amidohydrolase n=2 Tax=Paracidovorax citrulli TaxID=80869 RepID=A1TTD7_PARC0|nr:M20 aminoacylase family protein [Paracidovorax citrulli]ABM34225.1 amidohydrolase [Paracidovorax citrulli AAC00-1]ATG93724.1 amidohydrolase [Paracidovorax citrulli]PVY63669.1 hippurate hydrolase [Paracidovorax citrulli]QCX09651.1 putative hydrolase YxeP [Paracidovorax citrulli]REG67367.1 hippurate hydrolase [Paracidovorax citrulli]
MIDSVDRPGSYTRIDQLLPYEQELVAVRRHLHQNPELAFGEHATSDFIAGKLAEWGYDVTRGIGGTGVVGRLRHGEGSKTLGIRADMDALPIQEATGVPYASCAPGLMHACGHDGHMAMLLGAAKYLARHRNFSGTLHLIFQPAEERGFDSGGKAMVADGLFELFPCDAVFALHNHPGLPQGRFLMRSGPFMAAGDRVFVKVSGIGGHAARPHLAIDPLVAASAIVMSLQTVVARNVDPSEPAVVTVGRLRAGDALNVIPADAEIGISVRSFSPEVRALLKERITALVAGVAQAHGCSADIDYVEGYPVVVNDAAAVDLARQVAVDLVGPGAVDAGFPPLMGSEDFAYMLQRCPGALVRIGNGPADGGRGLHNPRYDFNDLNLPYGAAFWCQLAERFLR